MPADLLFDLNDDSLPELDSPPAQLTPLDESIAFIAAWIRVPISISEWAKKLAAIDCRTDQGRRLGNHDVKTTFQRLIARGQLVQTPGSGYQMPAPTANALAADLPPPGM